MKLAGHKSHTSPTESKSPSSWRFKPRSLLCPNPLSTLSSMTSVLFVTCKKYHCVFGSSRWWRWWRGGRSWGAPSILLRLRHAFPHRLLEGSVCLRPANRVLERLGLLLRVHQRHRAPHRHHRGFGIAFRLHRGAAGHCDRRGVCGAGNFHSRWVNVPFHCVRARKGRKERGWFDCFEYWMDYGRIPRFMSAYSVTL